MARRTTHSECLSGSQPWSGVGIGAIGIECCLVLNHLLCRPSVRCLSRGMNLYHRQIRMIDSWHMIAMKLGAVRVLLDVVFFNVRYPNAHFGSARE